MNSILEKIKSTRHMTLDHWRYRLLHICFSQNNITHPSESQLPKFLYTNYCPLFHLTNLLVLISPLIFLVWCLKNVCYFVLSKIDAIIPVPNKEQLKINEIKYLLYNTSLIDNPKLFYIIYGPFGLSFEEFVKIYDILMEEKEKFEKEILKRKIKKEKLKNKILFLIKFSNLFFSSLFWLLKIIGISLLCISVICLIALIIYSLISTNWMKFWNNIFPITLALLVILFVLSIIFMIIGKILSSCNNRWNISNNLSLTTKSLFFKLVDFSKNILNNCIIFVYTFYEKACPPIIIERGEVSQKC